MKKINISIEHHEIKNESGESYFSLLKYFLPEFITAILIYFAINFIDSKLISTLGVNTYTSSGITNTLFHLIIKITEGFCVGMVILCGQYNGAKEYKKVYSVASDAFWITSFIGATLASLLYFGAPYVYDFYEVSAEIAAIGIPFIKLKAISVFFSFVVMAMIGFLRGIKNTKIPMMLFVFGGMIFVFFDYALILGKFGFTQMGFYGSGIASIIQYASMFLCLMLYMLFGLKTSKYKITLFKKIDFNNIILLVKLSWPVILDKAIFALCQVWLGKVISSISNTAALNSDINGNILLASFVAIKDLEKFSIIPGLAFASVITFLVSNDYRIKNWDGIKNNIKKVLILSAIMVFSILFLICMYPESYFKYFDKDGVFSQFASKAFPLVSTMVFFDLLQLILSAALRGTGNVKIVMWTRIIISAVYFIPLSYWLSKLSFLSDLHKFVLIYGSFYLATAAMGIIFIWWFKSNKWKEQNY